MPFLRKTALLTASVLIAAGFAANSIYANPPAQLEAAAVASQNYLKTIPWDAEYDVVVIGYGFAGGAAAAFYRRKTGRGTGSTGRWRWGPASAPGPAAAGRFPG